MNFTDHRWTNHHSSKHTVQTISDTYCDPCTIHTHTHIKQTNITHHPQSENDTWNWLICLIDWLINWLIDSLIDSHRGDQVHTIPCNVEAIGYIFYISENPEANWCIQYDNRLVANHPFRVFLRKFHLQWNLIQPWWPFLWHFTVSRRRFKLTL